MIKRKGDMAIKKGEPVLDPDYFALKNSHDDVDPEKYFMVDWNALAFLVDWFQEAKRKGYNNVPQNVKILDFFFF
jgi:hypothetical protein